MAESTLLKCKGLYTYPNALSELPAGALTDARDVVIDRDSVITPRRGYKLFGSVMSEIANQLLLYKGRLLRHHGTTLDFDSTGSGVFMPFSLGITGDTNGSDNIIRNCNTVMGIVTGMTISGLGIPAGATITVVNTSNNSLTISANTTSSHTAATLTCLYTISTVDTGTQAVRIKGIEANGNFYFTTDRGIRKISAANAAGIGNAFITAAGGIKALNGTATINPAPLQFFSQEGVISYRVVWGYNDANTNLILGVPSESIVIYNPLLALLIPDFNTFLGKCDTGAAADGGDKLGVTGIPYSSLRVGTSATAVTLYNALKSVAFLLDSDFGNHRYAGTSGNIVAITASTPGPAFVTSSVPHNLTSGTQVTLSNTNSIPSIDGTYYVNVPVITGGFTNGSAAVTVVTLKGLRVGDTLSGTGITAGSVISTLTGLGTGGDPFTVTMSHEWSGTTGSSTFTDLNLFTVQAATTTAGVGAGGTFAGEWTTTSVASKYPDPPGAEGTTQDLLALQAFYDDIVSQLLAEVPTNISVTAQTAANFQNSTQSATVTLKFVIPPGVTTNHIYQIYRTAQTTSSGVVQLSNLSPGDECGLVYEANPSTQDLLNQSITITDTVPDSLRGANLYTNPNSGLGIAAANEAPPLARDIALFQGTTFYANTQSKQRLNLSLLSITGMANKTLTTTYNSGTQTYTFVPTAPQTVTFNCVAASSLASSGTADYVDVYSANNAQIYRFVFLVIGGTMTGPGGGAGITLINVPLMSTADATTVASALVAAAKTVDAFSATNTFVANTQTSTTLDVAAATILPYLSTGAIVTGTDIPTSTTITAITQPTGTVDGSITLSAAATNSHSNVTVFTNLASISNQQLGAANAPVEHVANAGFTVAHTSVASGEDIPNKKIGISNAPTAAQAIDETARSLERVVNQNSADVVNAYYVSGPQSVPGAFLFEAKDLGTGVVTFNVGAASGVGSKFNPVLPEVGSSLTPVTTANESGPNRVYYSQYQQPEAVPLLNYIDVGAKDKAILRVMPLRDSLYIMKEDGIYRLSGQAGQFTVTLADASSILLAPDSASVLNNTIYFVGSLGVSTLDDTGVSVISEPIHDRILNVTSSIYTNFRPATFAVGYESDRSYYLFTIQNTSDLHATTCYRFNVFTNTWTQLTLAKSCGIVNTTDSRLYLGPTDVNYIEQERKDFLRTDQADREFVVTIPQGSLNGTVLTLGSLNNIGVGDVLLQTQYLTIGQYNILVGMISLDPGLSGADYYASALAKTGDDLSSKLVALAALLNADTKVTVKTYTASVTSDMSLWQTQANAIATQLNGDPNASFTTYPTFSGTTQMEASVATADPFSQVITLTKEIPFVATSTTVYKAITSSVTWAPYTMGDPGVMKHVREATILYETKAFNTATVSYGSDMTPGFVSIAFPGEGNGLWGAITWGDMTWGGIGTSAPLRTLVPLEQARCRYLVCKYDHVAAFEKYAIFGINFTFEMISTRAWR